MCFVSMSEETSFCSVAQAGLELKSIHPQSHAEMRAKCWRVQLLIWVSMIILSPVLPIRHEARYTLVSSQQLSLALP